MNENNAVARLRSQLSLMFKLQDELNCQVAPDWVERKFGWHRALYIEAAEYLEHMGDWKWWKKGTPDLAQARMELVDIWHFGLSMMLESSGGSPDNTSWLLKNLPGTLLKTMASQAVEGDLVQARHCLVDDLVGIAAGERWFAEGAFVKLMALDGLSFDELFKLYVGKNMLNRFRQDNGYKSGTYVKGWADGREDNEHLSELLEHLPADETLPTRILEALAIRYAEAKAVAGSTA